MRNANLMTADRRSFLLSLPVATAAGLAFAEASLFTASAPAQGAEASSDFQVFRAQELQDDVKALKTNPGNKTLVDRKSFTVALTTERSKTAPEFEWHEHRDHIFQILEGSTVYHLGGTPKGAHSTGPGEWLAPESEGAAVVTLNKGDMLAIPRGTPHRRSTAGSVTFMLISPQSTV